MLWQSIKHSKDYYKGRILFTMWLLQERTTKKKPNTHTPNKTQLTKHPKNPKSPHQSATYLLLPPSDKINNIPPSIFSQKNTKQLTNQNTTPPYALSQLTLSLIKLSVLLHGSCRTTEIQSTSSFSKENQDLLSLPAFSLPLWRSVPFWSLWNVEVLFIWIYKNILWHEELWLLEIYGIS